MYFTVSLNEQELSYNSTHVPELLHFAIHLNYKVLHIGELVFLVF